MSDESENKPETPPEAKAAPAVEVDPRKAKAKLAKNENLLPGYKAELAALGENPVRKKQLEDKIADLEKQIKG